MNTSLTSQNLDDKMGWAPLSESLPIAAAFLAGMPHVRWADFDSHGYTIVEVTRDLVTAEWWAVDTILERSTGLQPLARWAVRNGDPQLFQVPFGAAGVPGVVASAG